jgi:hypothetical protein
LGYKSYSVDEFCLAPIHPSLIAFFGHSVSAMQLWLDPKNYFFQCSRFY